MNREGDQETRKDSNGGWIRCKLLVSCQAVFSTVVAFFEYRTAGMVSVCLSALTTIGI